MRSSLVLCCIVAAIDAIHCVFVANLVGIDTQHGRCKVINEELGRDDVGAVDEALSAFTRTIESLSSESIDAVGKSRYLLTNLKCEVVGCSYGEDVGETVVVNHVIAATSIAFGDSPSVPSRSVVELRINYERSKVGTFTGTVQDCCLKQLLCKFSLCGKLLGIELTVLYYI